MANESTLVEEPRNGIYARVRVLEYRADDITRDLTDIKKEISGLRTDLALGQRKLSPSEKIALFSAGVAVFMALLGAYALIHGGGV